MPKVTWLGDEDASIQMIEQHGHVFIKGEPTDVPQGDAALPMLKANPMFDVGGKEPDAIVVDEEVEVDAVRRELDARRIKYRANANLASLRDALAKGA